MTESAKDLVEKTIREYGDKIHSKVQELHRKQLNRERAEAEIIEMQVEIENLETFVTLLAKTVEAVEDKEIVEGLKAQRRQKRGTRAHSQS